MTTEFEFKSYALFRRRVLPEGATETIDPTTRNTIVTLLDGTDLPLRDKNNKKIKVTDDPKRARAEVRGEGPAFPFSVTRSTKDHKFGGNGREVLDSSGQRLGRVRYLGRSRKS
jgi:hypothetical protein